MACSRSRQWLDSVKNSIHCFPAERFTFATFKASSQALRSSASISPWLPFRRASRKAISSIQYSLPLGKSAVISLKRSTPLLWPVQSRFTIDASTNRDKSLASVSNDQHRRTAKMLKIFVVFWGYEKTRLFASEIYGPLGIWLLRPKNV